MKQLAIAVIQLYRFCLSPFFPPSCRFHPTCSQYALESFEKHGFFRGLWLAMGRVARCHPFARPGYDPVD